MKNVVEFKGRKYMVLPLARLILDPAYQRKVSPTNVARIRASYDPESTRSLVVNKRTDGSFVVIDGQNRHRAMSLEGETHAMCEVHEGKTESEEARLFNRCNTGKPLVGNDLFRSLYYAKDTIAIDIVSLVSSLGFNIQIDKREKKNVLTIGCPQTLVNVYRSRGFPLLTEAMTIIAKTWTGENGAIEKEALKAPFIEGLCIARNQLPRTRLNIKACIDRLSKVTPGEIAQTKDSKRLGKRASWNEAEDISELILQILQGDYRAIELNRNRRNSLQLN
jgi:hypothetical protein